MAVLVAVVVAVLWAVAARLGRLLRARWSAAPPARWSTGQQQLQTITHDIQVRVMGAAGEVAFVTIDRRSPGEALLRRARCCLGEGLHDLVLPSGEALNLASPLTTQGLEGGEELVAKTVVYRPPVQHERPRIEIGRYGINEYTSALSEQQDRFEVFIDFSHEAAAVAEATEERVRANFEEDHFLLTICGRKADYVLRRRVGRKGAVRGDMLPVGFTLCPPRCTLLVSAHKRIELTLRPFPEKWLEVGACVAIQGLKDSPELNGSSGIVTGYVEAKGKFQPERYCVKLDEGKTTKKFKRGNLTFLQVQMAVPRQHEIAEEAAKSCGWGKVFP